MKNLTMYINLIVVSLAIYATFKGVQGIKSYDVSDLCASTFTPTLPLPPETTFLTFPASLNLPYRCVIAITDDYEIQIDVMSQPANLSAVSFPCDWRVTVANVEYNSADNDICLAKLLPWRGYTKENFTITVNPTTGIGRRGEFSLILSKVYTPCLNYTAESTTPEVYCCKGGVAATDLAECEIQGTIECVPRSMICDGIVNCMQASDERGCPAIGATAAGVLWGGSGGEYMGALAGGMVVGVGLWVV